MYGPRQESIVEYPSTIVILFSLIKLEDLLILINAMTTGMSKTPDPIKTGYGECVLDINTRVANKMGKHRKINHPAPLLPDLTQSLGSSASS